MTQGKISFNNLQWKKSKEEYIYITESLFSTAET